MKPSSMAWRMEYRWKGAGLPSGPLWPNSSSVLNLGVAVKAKKDRLDCRPRARAARRAAWSGVSTSPTSAAYFSAMLEPPRISFMFFAISPDCELCASSTMMA